MGLPTTVLANAVAAVILIGLAALTVGMFGPFGLIILGLFTWLACTRLSLGDKGSASSQAIFAAQMGGRPATPEEKAAAAADRDATSVQLRFFRCCGVVLIIAGAAGFAWQQWH
jgi:hypothetical protein